MKLKALLVALFAAGLAASIALASPADHGGGKGCTTTTAATTTGVSTTTTTSTTRKHDDDDDDRAKACASTTARTTTTSGTTCRRVTLHGTTAAGSLTLTVDSVSGEHRRLLAGTTVTLTVPAGAAKVKGRLCTDAAGHQTLQLESLKLGHHD